MLRQHQLTSNMVIVKRAACSTVYRVRGVWMENRFISFTTMKQGRACGMRSKLADGQHEQTQVMFSESSVAGCQETGEGAARDQAVRALESGHVNNLTFVLTVRCSSKSHLYLCDQLLTGPWNMESVSFMRMSLYGCSVYPMFTLKAISGSDLAFRRMTLAVANVRVTGVSGSAGVYCKGVRGFES